MRLLRKLPALLLAAVILACLCSVPGFAEGEGEDQDIMPACVKTVLCEREGEHPYPESEHDYCSNTDKTWEFTCPGASSLTVAFSGKTVTETKCDFIYILDKDGATVTDTEKYSGDQLSGAVITVPGDYFQIRLTSDGGNEFYGFSIDSITAEFVRAGHTLTGEGVYTEPTCTQDGFTTFTCSFCEQSWTVTDEGTAGHRYETTVVDPTCTESGYLLTVCSRCGDSARSENGTPALGHSWGPWETDEGGTQTRVCTVCGEIETDTILYGDLDDSQTVNLKDLLLFRQFLTGTDVEINLSAADMDHDGNARLSDYLQLKQRLAN